MYLDITAFGYGVGLVMVGWVCGMCVSLLMSVLRKAGRII